MNSKLQMMESGPVGKTLIYLGMPTIIGLLTVGFYNFVDSYFVSKLGTEAMGAISVVYPFITLVPGIGLLFGNGAAAFISELLGAGRKEKAEEVLSSTVFFCLAVSLLSQAVLFFLPPTLKAMGASAAVLPLAVEYSGILIVSFLFHIPSVALMNLVRAEGEVGLSTCSQLTGAVLNILLDPIFIFTLGQGIRGAAIATAISQFASFSVLIQHYLRKKSYLRVDFRKIRFAAWLFKPIFKVGVPLFAINLFQSLSLGAANIAAAPYGDDLVAALGIANRVVGMTTYAVTGFSRGYQTFISYNYGAGNPGRIREATRKAYAWGLGGGLVISAGQILLSVRVVGAFSSDAHVVSLGVRALIGASLLFFTYGFQAMAVVYLLCVKYSRAGLLFSVSRQGLVYLPVLFLFSRLWGMTGIFYAQAIADGLTTLLICLFLLKVRARPVQLTTG